MADVSVLNVKNGSYNSITTSEIVGSAAAGTIPCDNGKDNRLAVLVTNADDEGIKFTVKAPTSGGGVRSSWRSCGDYRCRRSGADTAV